MGRLVVAGVESRRMEFCEVYGSISAVFGALELLDDTLS